MSDHKHFSASGSERVQVWPLAAQALERIIDDRIDQALLQLEAALSWNKVEGPVKDSILHVLQHRNLWRQDD